MEARELIKDINEIFEKVVIELLFTFNISPESVKLVVL